MPGERSLAALRVLVTRPAGQGDALAAAIRARGGGALLHPLLRIEPLPAAEVELPFAALESADIALFISTNAVLRALAVCRERGIAWPVQLRCFAIGEATAAALARHGIACEAGTQAMNSETLLALPALAAPGGRRIVVFKGEGGRATLEDSLRARGAEVAPCVLYRRRAEELPPGALEALLLAERIDVALVTSGEALAQLLALLGPAAVDRFDGALVLVVPGERVAAQARAAGVREPRVALNAGDAAMLDALEAIAAARAGAAP